MIVLAWIIVLLVTAIILYEILVPLLFFSVVMSIWFVFIWALMTVLSSISNASEVGIKYGLQVTDQVTAKEVKFVSAEYQAPISNIFRHKFAVGSWFDQNINLGQSSSQFTAYSMGIKVDAGYLYVENMFGIGLISRTDALLSTNFEFTEELGAGIQDKLGKYIGFTVKHFSNAGLQLPNYGRNFMLISAGVRL